MWGEQLCSTTSFYHGVPPYYRFRNNGVIHGLKCLKPWAKINLSSLKQFLPRIFHGDKQWQKVMISILSFIANSSDSLFEMSLASVRTLTVQASLGWHTIPGYPIFPCVSRAIPLYPAEVEHGGCIAVWGGHLASLRCPLCGHWVSWPLLLDLHQARRFILKEWC